MRHERPVPGRPTPIDSVNAELLKAKLKADPLARKSRADLPAASELGGDTRAVIVDDMCGILEEGRESRGYADIYDLKRAGYHDELAAKLGPEAAKKMARRLAKLGHNDAFEEEAA